MRISFAVILLLIALPMVFAEGQCLTKEDVDSYALNARYAFLHARAEARRIGMEALISSIKEQGADASDLEDIRSDFMSVAAQAKEAADRGDKESIDNLVEQGRYLIDKFREKVRSLDVDKYALRQALTEAEQENGAYLQGLLSDAVEERKQLYLNQFDVRVCWHQKAIDNLKAKGYDISELQAQADTISEKSAELAELLTSAQEACDIPVYECTEDKANEFREMKNSINEDFKGLNKAIVQTALSNLIKSSIGLMDTGTQLVQAKINAIERKGGDASGYQEALDNVTSLIDDARSQYDRKDYESAKQTLKKARESFKEMQQKMKGDAG